MYFGQKILSNFDWFLVTKRRRAGNRADVGRGVCWTACSLSRADLPPLPNRTVRATAGSPKAAEFNMNHIMRFFTNFQIRSFFLQGATILCIFFSNCRPYSQHIPEPIRSNSDLRGKNFVELNLRVVKNQYWRFFADFLTLFSTSKLKIFEFKT